MKHKWLLLILALPLLAQPAVLTPVGPNGNIKAGSTVLLNINLSGSAGLSIAGVEGSIANPGGTVVCSPGAAATAAGKTVACAVTGGTLIFIVYGINATTLSDGTVLQIQVSIPPSAAAGTQVEAVTATSAASLAGDSLAIASGPSFSFAITSLCDLDSSGAADAADVQALVTAITARTTLPGMDITGEGKVDFVDLQRVINAARGQGCRVGA